MSEDRDIVVEKRFRSSLEVVAARLDLVSADVGLQAPTRSARAEL